MPVELMALSGYGLYTRSDVQLKISQDIKNSAKATRKEAIAKIVRYTLLDTFHIR